MRSVWTIVWVCLALSASACGSADSEQAGFDSEPPMDGATPDPSESSCAVDSDCVPAASTCCECPTFAVSASDPFGGDGCSEVNCDGLREENCSTLVAPVCVSGQCELSCQPLVLEPDEVCDDGFERDEFGCATKTCATSTDPNAECTIDEDCVEVEADCCGCSAGGENIAVPVDEATSFTAGLGCTGNEVCPNVDVCVPDVIPQCLAQGCTLAAPPSDSGPGSPTPCGLTELPLCPAGQVCVLNDPEANDDAPFGVGVCRPE